MEYCLSQLKSNAEIIQEMTRTMPDRQARWKPAPDSWSALEVVYHLLYEEREDFRTRLDIILHKPGQTWPGIDPEAWVTQRDYNQQPVEATLAKFLDARQESLVWLGELASPRWEAAYEARFGLITAADMLSSWVAHDLLHVRQLVRLRWAYTTLQLQPHKVEYAGRW